MQAAVNVGGVRHNGKNPNHKEIEPSVHVAKAKDANVGKAEKDEEGNVALKESMDAQSRSVQQYEIDAVSRASPKSKSVASTFTPPVKNLAKNQKPGKERANQHPKAASRRS